MTVFASLDDDSALAKLIAQGGVGVIPTDTIYGLVAPANDKEAVERLYALKDRSQKPGPVIAADIEQLIELGVDEAALRAVQHLWPNPLSIVIKSSDELAYVHQSVGSLAVRIPKDERLRKLLAKTGPLLTSSANLPGEPAATTLAEAKGCFGDRLDFYVDGGDLRDRPPSTVVRYTDGRFEVLRQGAVTINEKGEIRQ